MRDEARKVSGFGGWAEARCLVQRSWMMSGSGTLKGSRGKWKGVDKGLGVIWEGGIGHGHGHGKKESLSLAHQDAAKRYVG